MFKSGCQAAEKKSKHKEGLGIRVLCVWRGKAGSWRCWVQGLWQWRTLDNKDSVEAEESDDLKGQELDQSHIMCYSKTPRRSNSKTPCIIFTPTKGVLPSLGPREKDQVCYPARASPIVEARTEVSFYPWLSPQVQFPWYQLSWFQHLLLEYPLSTSSMNYAFPWTAHLIQAFMHLLAPILNTLALSYTLECPFPNCPY